MGESNQVFSSSFEADRMAQRLNVISSLGEGFEVGVQGKQLYLSKWNKEKRGCDYILDDMYDLTLDLSGNDGKRIGSVTVKLPGLEVELNTGWFSVKTDYGWSSYTEYDSPKVWKKTVLGDGE